MTKKDKKSSVAKNESKSVLKSVKDAFKLSVEPPPKAITPPKKKPGKKK